MEHEYTFFDIFNLILEAGSDLELLKTGRLVSKPWNEICCRILRKVSAVPLREDQDENEQESLEKFLDILSKRQSCFPPNWPSPFQNYKIRYATFADPNFVGFLQRPKINITTLGIVHGREFQPGVFESLLEEHKDSIIHFKMLGQKEQFVPPLNLTGKLKSSWKSLKSVGLTDLCSGLDPPCSHMEYVKALTANNEGIEQLRLESSFSFPNLASSIISQNPSRWRKLTHLSISSNAPPADTTPENIAAFMKWSTELDFPSLTHLKLIFYHGPRDTSDLRVQYTPYILPLVQKLSLQLESLETTFVPVGSLPCCPKLTHLCCSLFGGDSIQYISEQRFPSLTSVSVTVFLSGDSLHCQSPEHLKSHRKVETLTIFWDGSAGQPELDNILTVVAPHFPHSKDVSVLPSLNCASSRHLTFRLNELLRVPQLRALELPSASSDASFSGDQQSTYFRKVEQFFETHKKFLLLKELTHLRLEETVIITEPILACIGKLPKIKFLSFHWNAGLRAATPIPDYLGHVESLTIKYRKNKDRICEFQKYLGLSKTMDNLKLVQFEGFYYND